MTAHVLAALALVLTNSFARVELSEDGKLASLSDVSTGLALADPSVPFVEVRLADGSRLSPSSLSAEGGRLTFGFPGGRGELVLDVAAFDGGWTFETAGCSVPDAERLVFARVAFPRACKKGHISNVLMDDRCAVVVRGYTPDIDMNEIKRGHQIFFDPSDRTTYVAVDRRYGFVGKRAGLAAGPRGRILDMLKSMSRVAGVETAGCGGAWSLESEANRSSYLFAIWMDDNSVEDFIALARRSGCQMVHFCGWNRNIGHYDVDRGCFKDGLDGVAAAVAKIHAAGLKASFHTLSAAVRFGDAWIAPEWFDDFQTDAEYTLARPYRRGDRTLYVNEKPWEGHSRVLTGSSNGNILRIGDNLLQYDDFSRDKPYAFKGLRMAYAPYGEEEVYDDTHATGGSSAMKGGKKKGARRVLSRAEYPAGTPLSYVHQRYSQFYPKPGSVLAGKVTDAIANVYNTCGFDGIYLDGAEGFNSRASIDEMRMKTIGKLRASAAGIVNSTSSRNPFNWWCRSLIGTFDHPNYGVKSYHDRHIRTYKDLLEADLLATDLGWWNIRTANANGRGYFTDEVEYFGCKSAAWDSTVSMMCTFYGDRPLPFSKERLLTLTGWWMNARYARAIRGDLALRMREPGREFMLRQAPSGEWTATEFRTLRHRIATDDFARWTVDAASPSRAALRIEALYGADREAAKTNALRLVDASHFAALERSSTEGVDVDCALADDARHGRVIRFTASNRSAPRNASWACVGRRFGAKEAIAVNPVSALWVKGDGSGAVLNVQARKHPELGEPGCSENFVKLDFKGWRRVELLLRERDADESAQYDWPYENTLRLNTPAGVFRAPIGGKTVGELNFWLNGIKPGSAATVELGAWDSVPQKRTLLAKGAALEVNGRRTALPFDLRSGEYAECDEDGWTHYSEAGDPLRRVAAEGMVSLDGGSNEVRWLPKGTFARAEVTIFPFGRAEPAFTDLTPSQRRLLAEEYELPRPYDPANGFGGRFSVRVRPGETAALGFEILGPIKNPAINGRAMKVVLADETERIVCRDGRTWRAIRWIPGKTNDDTQLRDRCTERVEFASGAFESPLRLVSGENTVDLAAESSGSARINFVKTYDIPTP